ncbi:SLAM family member 5-like isoform X2 [Polypterus senegalus]|uniref:SLAM family member 5-like isoform X2 n=1 Tax=Polypterus senegalus TaxID=55291 RepID=UPI00196542FB|nr:SLAM family member 5-like isoform X2 [Polypterus senegalus]
MQFYHWCTVFFCFMAWKREALSTLQSDILHVKRKLGDSFTFPQKIPQDGFLRFGHFVTLSTVALISNWNISRLYTDKFLGRLQVDIDDRSLTITHLRLEDSGIYQLEDVTGDKFTKNYNLTVYGVFSVTQSDILQVKIKLGESFTFPETIPQEVFLKFGHSLKTLAQITNWTISRIYMDRFSERVQVNRAAHFLTLTHLRREDSGIYQLESVTGDEFIKTYNITVYMPVSPPKVSSVLSENGSCVLSCSVENHTQATVFWLPGDVALTEKSPFINILLVKIKEADKQYTCVAENPFSKENITVTTDEICARKDLPGSHEAIITHTEAILRLVNK